MGVDLLIVTPLFFGDASGASVYYQILSDQLSRKGLKVAVVGDRESESGSGAHIRYYAMWPRRSGRNKSLTDYAAYLVQNLQYLRLPHLVDELRPRTLLVHTSFYNHPGLFDGVMDHIRRSFPGMRMIADTRDRMLPAWRAHCLEPYDHIIACSGNVAAHLHTIGVRPERISHIPVIQERLPEDEEYHSILDTYCLAEGKYLLNVGAVSEKKGGELLLRAFQNVRLAKPEIQLVLAGLLKTRSPHIRELIAQPGVRYLGALPHKTAMALMRGAALCVNLSPNEGLPRASLEALALRRPVLLPPNVPEFDKHCRECVVAGRNPQLVARHMLKIMETGLIPDYPVQEHYPESVMKAFVELLG